APAQLAAGQSAHRILDFVSVPGGERPEIVPAQEMMRSGFHPREIKRNRNMPGLISQERVHGRMIPNIIAVLLALRLETRMKSGRDALGRHDTYVFRQKR